MYLIQEHALIKAPVRFHNWLPHSRFVTSSLTLPRNRLSVIALGIITGALWAQAVGSWVEMQGTILISDLARLLVADFHRLSGWRGRAAYLSIVGFIELLITFLRRYFGGLPTFQ
jgi:hypothetical protein